MATTLVKVYYLNALLRFHEKCNALPHVGHTYFGAYIDDFQLSVMGGYQFAMWHSVDMARALSNDVVEDELLSCLHPDKAQVTASTPQLAESVVRLLGTIGGQAPVAVVESLGIDTAAGRPIKGVLTLPSRPGAPLWFGELPRRVLKSKGPSG